MGLGKHRLLVNMHWQVHWSIGLVNKFMICPPLNYILKSIFMWCPCPENTQHVFLVYMENLFSLFFIQYKINQMSMSKARNLFMDACMMHSTTDLTLPCHYTVSLTVHSPDRPDTAAGAQISWCQGSAGTSHRAGLCWGSARMRH